VLARLSAIHPDALRDLLRMAWGYGSQEGKAKKRTAARRFS
jgi:hypothetical protein